MSKQNEIANRIAKKKALPTDPNSPVPSYFKLRQKYASMLNEMSLDGKSRGAGITKTDLVELAIELVYRNYRQDGIISIALGDRHDLLP